ncbi:hypothetical protein LSH36_859g02053 [Paralvinella palmiformis]|uniref:Uncharacterized protein n=1 Tax=Paralvinella palmiformis TaxID=53620 RepID=A0AAD9MTH4_9ANNE|nr:hypothetical protein LSH36_859g02053 [Paralvinella palmiformis]
MDPESFETLAQQQQRECEEVDQQCRSIYSVSIRQQCQQEKVKPHLSDIDGDTAISPTYRVDSLLDNSKWSQNKRVRFLTQAESPLVGGVQVLNGGEMVDDAIEFLPMVKDKLAEILAKESAHVRETVQKMVDEYQQLFDRAFLIFTCEDDLDESRQERYYDQLRRDVNPEKNPVSYKLATSYDMVIGSVSQFIKQMASHAKTATILFVGCGTDTKKMLPESTNESEMVKRILADIDAEWKKWHKANGDLCLPASVTVVITGCPDLSNETLPEQQKVVKLVIVKDLDRVHTDSTPMSPKLPTKTNVSYCTLF